jgi:hypothetical protein
VAKDIDVRENSRQCPDAGGRHHDLEPKTP